MKNEPKLFLQKLKLYFSTLFARSMPKAIFGTPDLDDNQILFSNIDLNEAELYTPDPEYFIHLVSIKDTDFLMDLFEQFPLLKRAIVLLYMDAFLAAINKHNDDVNKIQLASINDTIIVKVLIDGKETSIDCGKIISSYQASRYIDIFESGSINKNTAVSTSIENKISLDDKLTILDFGKLFNLSDNHYTCALVNNQSTISVKEFLKKANVHQYTHTVMAVREGDTARLNVRFCCEYLDVLSVQPAVVWFPKKTKTPIVI